MNNEHTPLLHNSYTHRPRSWLRGKQHFVLSIVVIALIIFSFGYYETRQYDSWNSSNNTTPPALLHLRNKHHTHTSNQNHTSKVTPSSANETNTTSINGKNHTVPIVTKHKIHNSTKINPENPYNRTTPQIDQGIPEHTITNGKNHTTTIPISTKHKIHNSTKINPESPLNRTTPSIHKGIQGRSPTVAANVRGFKFTNDAPPFSKAEHPIHPILTSTKAPYPTNSWFSSLFVRDSHGMHPGEASITTTPYTLKSKFQGLSISYAGNVRRDVNMKRIREEFHEDLVFATEYPAMNKSVISYDALTVNIQFFNFNKSNETMPGSMTAILTRGSPYITVEYNQTAPVLRTKGKFVKINNSTIKAVSPINNITDTRFEVQIEDPGLHDKIITQTWILYSSKPITFTMKSENHTAENILYSTQNDFKGILRAAVVPENEMNGTDNYKENIDLLDSYKDVIPIGADVNYEYANGKVKTVFDWKVKSLVVDNTTSDDGTGAQLLMVALPHQADCLSQALPIKSGTLRYRTVKGYTSGVLGSQWVLSQNATNVTFESSTPIKSEYKKWVRNALNAEWNSTLPVKLDPYFAGKEFARRARFAVIADALNETKISNDTVNLLKSEIEPWMNLSNPDPFVYEPVWGGVCSKNGIKGLFYMTDFGNGWYSDHHFHYGYFLYALAIIGRHDPSFLIKHQSVVSALIRDIANPDPNNQWYTQTRYFSWFDGHSFASGVFVLDEGKSQESISEAINAWYSIALIGEAMNNKQLKTLGNVLLSWEIKAAEYYWQMKSDSKIYENPFAQNKMVGQVAATRVNYKTWFGNLTEDMHVINVLPFTPITDAYMSKDFVKEEYSVLQKYGLERDEPKMLDSWRGYSYMIHAIINQELAWKELRTVQPQWYDDGNSHTNALYWIATRPE